ncbi:hypothetical protein GCM10022239_19240 [Leifsonia bigeumensis]|uniref:Lipoprotein n=1 Tax=Leifsonella bigeumensis TaxID=433643 RepID=A0ABP7FQI9_9MICO
MERSAVSKITLKVLAGGLAVVLAVGLSGCTVPAKTAAKLVNGKFVFVSCEDFTYDSISMGSIDFDNWKDGYVQGWSASGIGSVAPGDRITYGVAPDGFLTASGPLTLPLQHHRIDVYLEYQPTNGPSERISGHFDSRKLSTDHWLRGDGGTNDKPCD